MRHSRKMIMLECVPVDSDIEVGNRATTKAAKMGKKKVHIIQKDGSMDVITLDNVKQLPQLSTNLLSITRMLRSGWNLGNEGTTIQLVDNGS